MAKSDIRQINAMARIFGVDRIKLGHYIHEIKSGCGHGAPDLTFGGDGTIYQADFPIGSLYDISSD